MNAALLLLSSAWMTGQTPEVIIPVQHAHSASHGAHACASSCCDSHPLRDRIRGLFHRDRCDSCAPPRCETRPCHRSSCCAPAPCNPCCGTWTQCNNCGGGLLERIHSRLRRDCSSCCVTTSCCGSAAPAPAPAAEPIKEAPQKLPMKSGPEKAKQEASVIVPPAQAPLPAIQNAPAIAPTTTPALSPRIIESDNRNPF